MSASNIIVSNAIDSFMQSGSATDALNSIVNYGSFYSTQTQTNLTTFNPVTLNVTALSKGVSIDPVIKSKIVFANAGIYNIAFSAQFDKTDAGTDNVHIWLQKGGVDEPWSNTEVTLSGNNTKLVAAWNFFVDPAAGNYFQLVWYSADTAMRIFAQAQQTSPVAMPGIPSVILTVNQIG